MSGPYAITLEPLSNLNDHFKLHHVLRTFERTSKTVSHQKSNSKSHCLRTVPYALCGSEINSGSHICRVCTSSCCGGLVGGWMVWKPHPTENQGALLLRRHSEHNHCPLVATNRYATWLSKYVKLTGCNPKLQWRTSRSRKEKFSRFSN